MGTPKKVSLMSQGYIGKKENQMETTIMGYIVGAYIRILEHKMKATRVLGFGCFLCFGPLPL